MALVNADDYGYDPNQRRASTPPMTDFPGLTGQTPQMQTQPAGAAPMTGSQPPATDFGGGMADQQLRQIGDAWRKYYGSDPTSQQANSYLGNANYESAIQQAAQQRQAQPFDINAWGNNWLKSGGRTVQDFSNYLSQNPLGAGYSASGSHGDKIVGPNGQGWDAVIGAGLGGQGASWSPFGQGGAAPAGGNAGGIFSDPATQQWEQLIRTLTDRLQQPQPTWTPAQLELQQTQMLDPLERQRQQARQQVTQRFAQMGQGPTSGGLQQALQQVDQQFQTAEAQARSGIANQAIGREDTLFANNENRALAAANLFKQVPQYADQRMGMAQNTLMQNNPVQLLGLMNAFQNTGLNTSAYNNSQQQQFWQQLYLAMKPFFQQ